VVVGSQGDSPGCGCTVVADEAASWPSVVVDDASQHFGVGVVGQASSSDLLVREPAVEQM
jgi:hypothetical protein